MRRRSEDILQKFINFHGLRPFQTLQLIKTFGVEVAIAIKRRLNFRTNNFIQMFPAECRLLSNFYLFYSAHEF